MRRVGGGYVFRVEEEAQGVEEELARGVVVEEDGESFILMWI